MAKNAIQSKGGRLHRYAKPLIEELKRNGVTDYHVEMRRTHPKLCFRYRGRLYKLVYGASSSDHRANKNKMAQLRKMLR